VHSVGCDEYAWVRRQLNRWFAKNQRDLPWRQTRDAYQIWVSEIMLQQTQVATVIDYYRRFLARFPDVQSLASASQQEVLQYWAGLGYYRRARNLQLAAQQIVERHSGVFPRDVSQLQDLAGVGRYTAGAIASFAFDLPAPILETNTIRLLSRLLGMTQPIQTAGSQKRLWEQAEALLPARSGSGKVNQALMELGSLVCTPTQPKCGQCPLRARCLAHRQGLEKQIPVLKPKVSLEQRTHIGLLVRDRRNRILLRRNAPGHWWEGLWDLPWIEFHRISIKSPDSVGSQSIQQKFMDQFGIECELTGLYQTIRHAVTRYRIQYHCFTATILDRALRNRDGWQWAASDKLPPVVARFQKIRMV